MSDKDEGPIVNLRRFDPELRQTVFEPLPDQSAAVVDPPRERLMHSTERDRSNLPINPAPRRRVGETVSGRDSLLAALRHVYFHNASDTWAWVRIKEELIADDPVFRAEHPEHDAPAVVEPPREGPDDDYKIVCCEDCGLAYGSDGWIECVLPNEDWAKISTSHDEGGILCITCIGRRLKRLGLFGVPVMLCGTEAIRLADQDEAFERGWKVAEKAAQEQADEILRLRSALSAAQQDSERVREDAEQMRYAGAQLANLACNLAQRDGPLSQHQRDSLRACQERWDSVVVSHCAAVSPSPEPRT